MSEEQTAPADTRSASEKIKDLENATMATYQTLDNMSRDILTIKEAIKLLGNKVDSIVKASERSLPLNDDVLSKIMVENNVAELKEKVTNLVTQGILVPESVVGDNSFLVGQEVNDLGEVVNPRLQFTVQALIEEMRDKVKGSKAGDTISFQESKLKFHILETYMISTPVAAEPITEVAPETSNG
jgi:hypothetical protein